MAIDKFQIARQRAQQQVGAETQEQQEALRRRFASMGGLQSGAAIKQEQLAGEQGAKRLMEANQNIDVAQQGELERKAEVEAGRKFQSGEREAGQAFASKEAGTGREFAALQAEAQRKFASGERLSSQEFASLEAGKGREFATGERLGSQSFASLEALRGREFSKGERIAGQKFAGAESARGRASQEKMFQADMDFKRFVQDFAQSDAGRKYDLAVRAQGYEERVGQFNMESAEAEANKKDFFDKIGSFLENGWKNFSPAGAAYNYFS